MFKVEYFHKYLPEMLNNMQRLVVYILIISDELIRHKIFINYERVKVTQLNSPVHMKLFYSHET